MDNLNINLEQDLHENVDSNNNINGNLAIFNNLNNKFNTNPELILNPPPIYNPSVNYPSSISNYENKIENNGNVNKQKDISSKSFYVRDRLSIFIDGNNMFYAQQKNNWFFDPRRVIDYFTQDPTIRLINAFWYTGLKDSQDQRGFRDALISLGYTVRTKTLKEFYDEISGKYSQKANLDIEIVVDMFNTVEQYNRVVLFSGDGDFERAVELLRSKNTHITVVSTEGMIARELRNATDSYIDLNDIRAFIEKTDY